MKRQKKHKHDKAARHAALGAATAAAAVNETGQTHLPFETHTLPMNASQPEDDRGNHCDSSGEATSGIAQFDAAADDGRETFAMPANTDSGPTRPGARLRAAREAKCIDLEQAASRLRLPQRLLQAIEADDYSRIDHGVYLRGYLTSYARLVDLPESEIAHAVPQDRQTPPPLVATGRISHSRWLYQRYSVPAVYLLLTALIVGPSVWLATHGGLDRNLARLSTLDTSTPATGSPVATPVTVPTQTLTTDAAKTSDSVTASGIAPIEEPATTSPAKPVDQQPLMASLAPFTATESKPPAAAPSGIAASEHSLHLKLSEASWVEISADDGRKLEYAILPAGSERDYRSNSPLSVRIGNTTGAVVVLDGKAADLAPFRHSNVAYFRAFGPKGDIASAD